MMDERIYSRTAKGRAKLRTPEAGLSRSKSKVLELLDGKQSLGVLTEAMAAMDRANFMGVIGEFEKQGLIQLPKDETEIDRPTATVEVTELGPQESVQAWAEANRGALKLKEDGFYANPGRVAPSARSHGIDSLHVLVIDDDDDIVKLLSLLLQDKGHVVTSALTGFQGLAELKKPVVPDLVLLDVMLPDHDGFDILAAIRGNSRLSRLPVIMVTGKVDSADVMKGLTYGADGYIFKPFKWATLYECIQAVTGYL